MRPSVTVVTPAYDAERFVGEAIRSVTQQTFTDFEHLIVDDGSRDSTASVALRHARADSRLRLLTLVRNRGLSCARNEGIAAARGRYIAFLDADDLWEPGFLAETVEAIRKVRRVGAVFTWSKKFVRRGGAREEYRPRPGRYGFSDLFMHGCAPGNGSALLIRKECFREAGTFLPRYRVGMDSEMWLRISLRARVGDFYCVPRFLLLRRLRPDSLSADYFCRDRELAYDYILRTYLPELPETAQILGLRAYLDTALRRGAARSPWLDAWVRRGGSARELVAHLSAGAKRGVGRLPWLDAWSLRALRRYGPKFFSFENGRDDASEASVLKYADGRRSSRVIPDGDR